MMKVLGAIDHVAEPAPLHNSGCPAGIRAARLDFGSDLSMVGVLDMNFHRSIPPRAGKKSDVFSILLAVESIQWMKSL
jgi:acetate kinase